jgi:preprotein translocase subunit SecE
MSKKKQKNNRLSKLMATPKIAVSFFREAREELKKVTWPDRKTTTRYTIIVIAASLFVGIVIGGIDYLFTRILEKVI